MPPFIGTSKNNKLYQPNSNAPSPDMMDKQVRRFVFTTKSDIDVLDDGFKWRKYGKKIVKNRQNPRNYYKCCVAGCTVKKRIERDNDDPSCVITTYQGTHNHIGPRS